MDWGLISSHLPPQGPRAEAMMHSAMEQGKWVFFQNCHLAPSWMPSLERLIEGINPNQVTPRSPWLRKTFVPTPHNSSAAQQAGFCAPLGSPPPAALLCRQPCSSCSANRRKPPHLVATGAGEHDICISPLPEDCSFATAVAIC